MPDFNDNTCRSENPWTTDKFTTWIASNTPELFTADELRAAGGDEYREGFGDGVGNGRRPQCQEGRGRAYYVGFEDGTRAMERNQ